jgi:SNF2 family DNA or RNA helicase
MLEEASTTAHSILADGYEVVIVSYEFLESNLRSMEKYRKQSENEDHDGHVPRRPTSALQTNLWRILKLPIKRLILDESQRIKNYQGRKHLAALNLSYSACIMLSGTFLDNKWTDVYGLLPFLRGHPFQTFKSFQKAFATYDYEGNFTDPEEHRIRLLQKLLLAIVIARPASLLNLSGCQKRRVGFILRDRDSIEVALCVEMYIKAQKEASATEKKRLVLSNVDPGEEDGHPLVHAIIAQQYSLHPALVVKGHTDTDYDLDHDDFQDSPDDIISHANAKQEEGGDIRVQWLQSLQTVDLVTGSARVQQFCHLYQWVRNKYPEEKILVFSCYLKYLDIIAAALRQEFEIEALRYDGTVKSKKRETVKDAFRAANAEIPLLVTAGTGGVGLNLTEASIIIQTEIWWNHNAELQVYARCHRQGQTRQVKVFRLFGENSAIDLLIWTSQTRKTVINKRLMAPLVRSWDAPAIIPEIAQTTGFMPLQVKEEADQEDDMSEDE